MSDPHHKLEFRVAGDHLQNELAHGKPRPDHRLRLLQVVESVKQVGSWYLDPLTRHTFWSSEMFRIFGLSPEAGPPDAELVRQVVHPEDWERFEGAATRALLDGIGYELELRLLHCDGSIRYVVARCAVEQTADGTVVRLIGTVQDLTAWRDAENLWRRHKEQNRKLIEHIPQGTFRQRADGSLVEMNPAALGMLGLSREEFEASGGLCLFMDAIYEDGSPCPGPEHPAQVALTLGATVAGAVLGVRHAQSGELVWMEVTAVPGWWPDDPDTTQVLVTMHDITERKRVEEALKEAELSYRTIADFTYDWEIWEYPVETLRYVSPACERITGYAAGAFYADPSLFRALILKDDWPVWASHRHEITTRPDTCLVCFRIRRRDGQVVWIEHACRPVTDERGAFLGFRSSNRDITARKLAEEALESERALLAERVESRTADLRLANAQLARAARLKDEFLTTMSHELRTPLNDILGRAELLEAGIYGPSNPEQVEALRGINASGRHLLALITDILDLSKIEAGKLTLDLAIVDVSLVCRMSVHMVAQSAQTKQIALSSELDPQVAAIYADERRLKQILVNLLANAIKFTPEGGMVGLEVAGDRERQLATFTVWDTGIGIAEEHHARLFQPFTQIDSGLNRQYVGTGLGLSLVARLTRAHGGDVAMVSAPGDGSRFSVSLPWSPALEPPGPLAEAGPDRGLMVAPPTWQAQPAEPGRETQPILLVDDNQTGNLILKQYLVSHGYPVDMAGDGSEALERMRTVRPALVLMDIQLPGMDGLTAIRHIRADPRYAALPIIALTALAMPGDRERCLAAGADAYFAKPVSLRTLLATIGALLSASSGGGAPLYR